MKVLLRRWVLMMLASLPVASIAFAAQKALSLGELTGGDEVEYSSSPSGRA